MVPMKASSNVRMGCWLRADVTKLVSWSGIATRLPMSVLAAWSPTPKGSLGRQPVVIPICDRTARRKFIQSVEEYGGFAGKFISDGLSAGKLYRNSNTRRITVLSSRIRKCQHVQFREGLTAPPASTKVSMLARWPAPRIALSGRPAWWRSSPREWRPQIRSRPRPGFLRDQSPGQKPRSVCT